MKKVFALAATLALLLPAPPASADSKIITSYAGSPSAPFSSATYHLTNLAWARMKIRSNSTSSAIIDIEHKTGTSDTNWTVGFTCTDPDSTGVGSDGLLCYVDLSKTSDVRATIRTYASGTITVTLETEAAR